MAAVQISALGDDRHNARDVIRLSNGIMIVAFLDNTAHVLRMFYSNDTTGAAWTEFSGTPPPAYYMSSIATDGTLWYVCWATNTPDIKFDVATGGSDRAYPAGDTVKAFAPNVGDYSPDIAIALDASNGAHIVYIDYPSSVSTVYYTNNIGGWNASPLVIDTGTDNLHCDIAIDTTNAAGHRYNLPQIAYVDTANNKIKAALGDATDASTFSYVNPASKDASESTYTVSMCIDSGGKTSIAFCDNSGNRVPFVVWISGTGTWTTTTDWTSQQAATFNLFGISLAAYGPNRYLFGCKLDGTNEGKIQYSVSTNYGAWSAPTTIEDGYLVKARWQYANNPDYATYGLDYTFSVGNNIFYWNKLAVASLAPNYSREAAGSLPADDTDLSTIYSAGDKTNVGTEGDALYVDQIASGGDYAIHEFKNTVTGTSCGVEWAGKSDYAPSESIVKLQAYNRDTTSWVDLDSDNTTGANTDFELIGTIAPGDIADYVDESNVIAFRVWQKSPA